MYICLLEEVTYHKSVALPIQWEGWLHRLIQKVDLKGWFESLGKSGDWWLSQPRNMRDELWYEIVPINLDQSRD